MIGILSYHPILKTIPISLQYVTEVSCSISGVKE